MHETILQVTERICKRSAVTRADYLQRMRSQFGVRLKRAQLGCTNLAHAASAADINTKLRLKQIESPNIAIISAYNDMLSAHQPYYRYPELIKEAIFATGATAQVAGGVPAMCDGITQGQIGMELSLFSRDVIAQATAISLSHNVFDGILCLGICDKIVPGLLIGALSFGYLPTIFIPSGPMPSGISNQAKAQIRKLYAEAKVGEDALLESEMQAYHSSGTCTFYGTANSNQMLMEIMGLHIPGSAFVAPHSDLRKALTIFASKQVVQNTGQQLADEQQKPFVPLCAVVTEKSIVNAMIGLIATGGSTNHTIHLPAIAKACGILINWDDFAALAKVVPLLAKVYPNGEADINQFHQAGGVAYVIKELLHHGLLHEDVVTVIGGKGLVAYADNPTLNDKGELMWQNAVNSNQEILSTVNKPFSNEGGLRLLTGNLGRAVSKVSAIKPEHRYVKAKALVFQSQDAVLAAYHAGLLHTDCVVVLTHQGPHANGMPELHGLTPALASIQDSGYKIALVTDGRLSGASGKIPNAIHVTPESERGGMIACIRNGDIMELDLDASVLKVLVADDELLKRKPMNISQDNSNVAVGLGRELFKNFRYMVSSAEEGASAI